MRARQGRHGVVATALVAVLAAGCSSGSDPRFELSDLSAECGDAGADLLAVETAHRRLKAEEAEPQAVAGDYEQAQPRLLAAREQAPPEVAAALRRLVTSLGFFRVGAAAGTLGDAQVDQVQESLDAALISCGVELED